MNIDWSNFGTYLLGVCVGALMVASMWLGSGCAQGIYREVRPDGTVIEAKINTLCKDYEIDGIKSTSNPVSIWTLWGIGKTKENEQ